MRAAAITVALMALLTTSAFARPHTDNGARLPASVDASR